MARLDKSMQGLREPQVLIYLALPLLELSHELRLIDLKGRKLDPDRLHEPAEAVQLHLANLLLLDGILADGLDLVSHVHELQVVVQHIDISGRLLGFVLLRCLGLFLGFIFLIGVLWFVGIGVRAVRILLAIFLVGGLFSLVLLIFIVPGGSHGLIVVALIIAHLIVLVLRLESVGSVIFEEPLDCLEVLAMSLLLVFVELDGLDNLPSWIFGGQVWEDLTSYGCGGRGNVFLVAISDDELVDGFSDHGLAFIGEWLILPSLVGDGGLSGFCHLSLLL